MARAASTGAAIRRLAFGVNRVRAFTKQIPLNGLVQQMLTTNWFRATFDAHQFDWFRGLKKFFFVVKFLQGRYPILKRLCLLESAPNKLLKFNWHAEIFDARKYEEFQAIAKIFLVRMASKAGKIPAPGSSPGTGTEWVAIDAPWRARWFEFAQCECRY
jgi:hypothetical protein